MLDIVNQGVAFPRLMRYSPGKYKLMTETQSITRFLPGVAQWIVIGKSTLSNISEFSTCTPQMRLRLLKRLLKRIWVSLHFYC